jgi:hypothetical protein
MRTYLLLPVILVSFIIFSCKNNTTEPTDKKIQDSINIKNTPFLNKKVSKMIISLNNIDVTILETRNSSNYKTTKDRISLSFNYPKDSTDKITQSNDSLQFQFRHSVGSDLGGEAEEQFANIKFDSKNNIISSLTVSISNSNWNSYTGGHGSSSSYRGTISLSLINVPYVILGDTAIECSLSSFQLNGIIKNIENYSSSFHQGGYPDYSSSSDGTKVINYTVDSSTSLYILIK